MAVSAYGGNRTSGPIDVSPALNTCGRAAGRQDFETEAFIAEVAGTLPAGGAQAKSAGTATGQDAAAGLLVAHALRAEGFDASEDGTGRGTPIVPVVHAFDARQSDVIQYGDRTGPLDTDGHTVGVLAFSAKDHGGDATHDLAPTMRAIAEGGGNANGGGQLAVAFQSSQSGVRVADTHATLDANNGSRRHNGVVVPAVAFHENQRGEITTNDTAGSLKVGGGKPGQGYPAVAVPALTASNDPSRSPQSSEVTQQVAAVHAASMAVRRLTPRECERLQGFPDDYTKISEKTADGPRYKALGNSMAVPVMRWIGERINKVTAA